MNASLPPTLDGLHADSSVVCPLCGSGSSEVRWKKGHAIYRRCLTCTLVFQYPRPSPAELSELYSRQYYHKDCQGGDVIGYDDYEPDLPLAREILRPLFPPPVPGATLLDVGCATGMALEAAREMGWDARGVEISPWASDVARKKGFSVEGKPLRECMFPDASFDAVTLFQVIEHFADPLAELQEIHRILKPGGRLVLETPNIESPPVRWLYGPRSILVQPDAHLVLFSKATIRRAIEESGLHVEAIHAQPHGRTYRRVLVNFLRRAAKRPLAAVGYRLGPINLRTLVQRPDNVELPQITCSS